jgi:hypothetical protein
MVHLKNSKNAQKIVAEMEGKKPKKSKPKKKQKPAAKKKQKFFDWLFN